MQVEAGRCTEVCEIHVVRLNHSLQSILHKYKRMDALALLWAPHVTALLSVCTCGIRCCPKLQLDQRERTLSTCSGPSLADVHRGQMPGGPPPWASMDCPVHCCPSNFSSGVFGFPYSLFLIHRVRHNLVIYLVRS